MKQAKFAILIALGMSLTAASAAAQQLRSPWDSAVKVTNAPYRCPQPVHLSPDLTTEGFYGDSKRCTCRLILRQRGSMETAKGL